MPCCTVRLDMPHCRQYAVLTGSMHARTERKLHSASSNPPNMYARVFTSSCVLLHNSGKPDYKVKPPPIQVTPAMIEAAKRGEDPLAQANLKSRHQIEKEKLLVRHVTTVCQKDVKLNPLPRRRALATSPPFLVRFNNCCCFLLMPFLHPIPGQTNAE